jgi:SAM-dependent methyltransferase
MSPEQPPEQPARYRSDLCCIEGGISRVDSMDPERKARVVEMLEGRASDPAQRELRARFYELAGIAAGRRVLDVGCGTGADTRSMAARVSPGGSVLGIDPSESLLVEARRRTPPDLPARYERSSGESLGPASESFDRAVAITTLSHVPDPRPVVAEMVRVTRKGGRVALFDHDMGTFVIDAADREVTRLIFHRYTQEVSGMDAGRRLHGLLKEAGLRGVLTVPLPLVDTEFSSYFQFVVDHYPSRAVEDGALAPEKAEAWRRDIRARAAQGRFFGSLVYFAAVGTR